MNKTIYCIVGPTASGKTEFAVSLAQRANGEIISADSRQVYKHLNIGTGKMGTPGKVAGTRVYRGITQHLIDIIEPEQTFSTAEFCRLAGSKIRQLNKRNKVPIIVGGTGLYIKSLLDGIYTLPDRDEQLRQKLVSLSERQGTDSLYRQLQECDPVSAIKIHPHNLVRIIRALEVFKLTGKPISYWHKLHQQEKGFPSVCFNSNIGLKRTNKLNRYNLYNEKKWVIYQFGLQWTREQLYQRINLRVDWMLSNGMVEETELLISRGIPLTAPVLLSVGYKWVIEYLQKGIDYSKMCELIQRDTRRYAKRQLTWFNCDKRIKWIAMDQSSKINEIIDTLVNPRF